MSETLGSVAARTVAVAAKTNTIALRTDGIAARTEAIERRLEALACALDARLAAMAGQFALVEAHLRALRGQIVEEGERSRRQRAIEIIPSSKPLRWRRYDVPQHLAPETSDALRFCAVEGDLDLLDRRHRSTIEARPSHRRAGRGLA